MFICHKIEVHTHFFHIHTVQLELSTDRFLMMQDDSAHKLLATSMILSGISEIQIMDILIGNSEVAVSISLF